MRGSFISAAIALLSVIGLAVVFVSNASPYATVAEVEKASADNAHVVGAVEAGTLKQNLVDRTMSFTLRDETGTMPVIYSGPPLSTLDSTSKVVVIGKYESGIFQARNALVKCPSKYEKSGG